MRAVLILEAERNYREALSAAVAFVGHRPIAVGGAIEARIVLELEPVACVIVGDAEGGLLEELRAGPLSARPRILVAGQQALTREHEVRRFDRKGLLEALAGALGVVRARRVSVSA